MTSETIGCDERMNDSLQQVHSWKWNQTTGSLGFVSSASTTFPTPDASIPAAAASQLQNLTKSRREYPASSARSQIVRDLSLILSSCLAHTSRSRSAVSHRTPRKPARS